MSKKSRAAKLALKTSTPAPNPQQIAAAEQVLAERLVLLKNRLALLRDRYAEHPVLLAAWAERWRMQGATSDEVQAKLGKILQGVDPPKSEAAVAEMLAQAGFGEPVWFFSSLFWGACMAQRADGNVATV
jgi:hypothetical protein